MQQDKRITLPLLTASLFPDLVDKTIGYILRLMPNGRHYTHNIFSLVGLSAIVALIWGRTTGRAWFIGYLGHLIADSYRQVPWLFPIKKYAFKRGKLTFQPSRLIPEMILLLLMLLTLRLSR